MTNTIAPAMKPAASPDELAADPVGHYWLGSTQLVWCSAPSICGATQWGQPGEKDVHELTQALELALHPDLDAGFEVYMDASGIDRVEWAPFTALADYVRRRLPEWTTRIRKQAVIVPDGPAGPLLAGMVPMLGMTYPLRFFPDDASALEWLGWQRRTDALDAIAEAKQLVAAARQITPVVHHLRHWLDGALADPSLEAAAAALGTSTRSLQRELQEARTSLTAEVQAARVRVACTLLAETDDKIEVIARTVGCTSASQLSTLFRRLLAETPARYREKLAASRTARR